MAAGGSCSATGTIRKDFSCLKRVLFRPAASSFAIGPIGAREHLLLRDCRLTTGYREHSLSTIAKGGETDVSPWAERAEPDGARAERCRSGEGGRHPAYREAVRDGSLLGGVQSGEGPSAGGESDRIERPG